MTYLPLLSSCCLYGSTRVRHWFYGSGRRCGSLVWACGFRQDGFICICLRHIYRANAHYLLLALHIYATLPYALARLPHAANPATTGNAAYAWKVGFVCVF